LEDEVARVYNFSEVGDPARPALYARGAIDVGQSARRLVSLDRKTSMLTVIADERYPATWVKSRHVTGQDDDRPTDDDPRRGSRAAPGTILLRAHDPRADVETRSVGFGNRATRPGLSANRFGRPGDPAAVAMMMLTSTIGTSGARCWRPPAGPRPRGIPGIRPRHLELRSWIAVRTTSWAWRTGHGWSLDRLRAKVDPSNKRSAVGSSTFWFARAETPV
jgi:hypothetical protein